MNRLQSFLTKFRQYPRPFDRIAKLYPHNSIIEVGVGAGEHAAFLLKYLKPSHLVLVDPYIEYKDLPYEVTQRQFYLATKRIGKNPAVQWCRKKSTDTRFLYNSFDAIYIDSEHSYETDKADIEHFWPIVKSGGIIGGHDFHYTWPGVVKAVIEFAVKNNLTLNCETPDWWIIKP